MHVREGGKAIEDFSAVIEADPENFGAYMTRGFVLSNLGRHEEAAKDYGRLVELAPDDPMGYHLRGYAHAYLGRHERAIEDFGRAIALDPGAIDARSQRARLYRQPGQSRTRAVRDYDELIRLRPDDPSILRDRQLAVEEAEAARR